MGRELTHSYVKEKIEENAGYLLVSVYDGSIKPLLVKHTICDKVFETCWNRFNGTTKRAGSRCPDCSKKSGSRKRQKPWAKYLEVFTKHGFKLLIDQEYYENPDNNITVSQKVLVQCVKCLFKFEKAQDSLTRKVPRGCQECGRNSTSIKNTKKSSVGNKRPVVNNETITAAIEQYGFKIREGYIYINKSSPLDLVCPVNESHICNSSWDTVKKSINQMKGPTCTTCSVEKMTFEKRKPFYWTEHKYRQVEWRLLFDKEYYENPNNTMFNVICDQGHPQFRNWRTLVEKGDPCCRPCYEEARKLPLDEVIKSLGVVKLELVEYCGNTYNHSVVQCIDCHYKFNVKLTNIRFHFSGCPACKASGGEKLVRKYLESRDDLKFTMEYKFPNDMGIDEYEHTGCRDIKDLPFDFHIETNDGDEMLIEVDGEQHFKSIDFFGGEDAFEKRLYHDLIKTSFADQALIPILRLSFQDLNKATEIIKKFINKVKISNQKLYFSNRKDYELFNLEYEQFVPPW